MWLCTVEGLPPLTYAALSDQSGTYGLTKVKCTPVTFGRAYGRPLSLIRALGKIVEIIGEL